MLWEIEVYPAAGMPDREAARVKEQCAALGVTSIGEINSARSFLIQGDLTREDVEKIAAGFLVDQVVETYAVHEVSSRRIREADPGAPPADRPLADRNSRTLVNVLYKPGVTDNVADSIKGALVEQRYSVSAVRTCLKYRFSQSATDAELKRVAGKILSNDAIQQVVWGPLGFDTLALGSAYAFHLTRVPLSDMNDEELMQQSRQGQLYLSLPEMRTIQEHFSRQRRDPTDAELETIAQTWSEHCSHKTLRGRVRYRDERGETQFENLLKETVFAATAELRRRAGAKDFCVSVFQDNAGVVKFDERQNVCMKVETHNHPSALEPYGGANTGLGGVIRDPLGTGLGAKPIANTDVFCFAPPDMPYEQLPAGVLHPRVVAQGVVAGVRDYGNRMGIPTVNGSIYFDERYLGNPLVFCGNVAMIPVGLESKTVHPGDLIVAVGGRTGRDGIHGATFSSAELTHESEALSGGAVQIGNAITEKMVVDVILEARDRKLYTAITDCGAGGFSSAVGEMAAETGAEVWLEKAPLKYAGLSYTEIWISEAQERMVLAVPESHWNEFERLCRSEGVEATAIGRFTDTKRLKLFYDGHEVGDLSMDFLHEGRPPVVRDAVYIPPVPQPRMLRKRDRFDEDLKRILGSLNVCSKEWVIRQYDHEVQAGSVVKPLVGVAQDGPSDAAVVRPDLKTYRGLVIANGMNPCYGDFDPYWMAASAIDEAVRNCVAVGADPERIAILDNFCWGNTDRPETLGSLVRAALGCRDIAIAYGTPFVSGKDSLNNEFSFLDKEGNRRAVAIPPSLLISALGQIDDIRQAVTMDVKTPGNLLFLIGTTRNELGGSHFMLVNRLHTGDVPRVEADLAVKIFQSLHAAMKAGYVRSCHDLSEGGLAVSLAEMCFAGQLGAEISLRPLADHSGIDDAAVLLFSESNTRFLVEVPGNFQAAFLETLIGLPVVELGSVTDGDNVLVRGIREPAVIDSRWVDLKRKWKQPLDWD